MSNFSSYFNVLVFGRLSDFVSLVMFLSCFPIEVNGVQVDSLITPGFGYLLAFLDHCFSSENNIVQHFKCSTKVVFERA